MMPDFLLPRGTLISEVWPPVDHQPDFLLPRETLISEVWPPVDHQPDSSAPGGALLPGRRRASKRQSPGEGKGKGKGPVKLYAESEALSRIFRPAAQAGQSHHFPPRALTSRA